MRARRIAWLIPLFLVAPACADGARAPDAAVGDTVRAFVDVDVIPMDTERVLADHTVVVEGDRVVAVGPEATTPVPDGAIRIDGDGKFLIPGLAEMHGHIPPPDAPAHHVESVEPRSGHGRGYRTSTADVPLVAWELGRDPWHDGAELARPTQRSWR